MNKKVEVSIILFSKSGREINFQGLKSGKCYLEHEEMTPFFFWSASGGFEITIDGYKTIFRGLEFYVSLEAIRFLLHSLFWLHGKPLPFDTDDIFPKAVVSRFQSKNYIKLFKKEKDILGFTYQSTLSSIEAGRGNRFIDEEQFFAQKWNEAVQVALKEYFDVLVPILIDYPGDEQTKILCDYLVKEWDKIKEN